MTLTLTESPATRFTNSSITENEAMTRNAALALTGPTLISMTNKSEPIQVTRFDIPRS